MSNTFRHKDKGKFNNGLLDKIPTDLENMFNRKYYPLYSQLLRSGDNTSHLVANGATLKVSYSHKW